MKNKSVAWRTVRTLAILVKKKKKEKKNMEELGHVLQVFRNCY